MPHFQSSLEVRERGGDDSPNFFSPWKWQITSTHTDLGHFQFQFEKLKKKTKDFVLKMTDHVDTHRSWTFSISGHWKQIEKKITKSCLPICTRTYATMGAPNCPVMISSGLASFGTRVKLVSFCLLQGDIKHIGRWIFARPVKSWQLWWFFIISTTERCSLQRSNPYLACLTTSFTSFGRSGCVTHG